MSRKLFRACTALDNFKYLFIVKLSEKHSKSLNSSLRYRFFLLRSTAAEKNVAEWLRHRTRSMRERELLSRCSRRRAKNFHARKKSVRERVKFPGGKSSKISFQFVALRSHLIISKRNPFNLRSRRKGRKVSFLRAVCYVFDELFHITTHIIHPSYLTLTMARVETMMKVISRFCLAMSLGWKA